jgi:hypothetical protein
MMPIDGIINGTNGIINQNRGEESMNAVIYARYSSDSQREESIEGQIRECTEYAKRNGITVLGTYIDRALSARSADRLHKQKQALFMSGCFCLFWTYGVWPLPKAMQIDIFIVLAYNIAELNISEFHFSISVQKEMSGCL